MRTASILHLDLDTFFVSVERLLDPSLIGKPVIVGGNPLGRGVVSSCSYEARTFGVHSAQPIGQAYKLCPNAIFVRGHYAEYGEYSKRVRTMLTDLVPVCEAASIDEFYLDLSDTERLKGDTYLWAQEIRRKIVAETKLPMSFGLATNKLVAKVATTQVAKKNELRHHHVPAGEEASFFAPFEIRALPGIGKVSEQKLRKLGIERLGQLASTPLPILTQNFGSKAGRSLHDRALGISYSPVVQSREQKSYSRERTFGEDISDPTKLASALLSLSSTFASDLREAKICTGKVTLKLRYSDFTTVTKSLTCSWTNQDQSIYRLAEKLFHALWTPQRRVRLLGLDTNVFIEDVQQQSLFDEQSQDAPIYTAVDDLRSKYGKSILGFAGARRP